MHLVALNLTSNQRVRLAFAVQCTQGKHAVIEPNYSLINLTF